MKQFFYTLMLSLVFQVAGAANLPNWRAIELALYQSPASAITQLQRIDVDSLDDAGKASYYAFSSSTYQYLFQPEVAAKYLSQAAPFYDEADDYTKSLIRVQQAYEKEVTGDIAGAYAGYLTAVRLANNTNSVDAKLLTLVYLVNHYSVHEPAMTSALNYAEQAARLTSATTRLELTASLHNILGNIHSYLSDYEFSEQQYAISLRLYRELNNRIGEANVLYNMASLLESTEDYTAAIRAYEQYIVVAESWGSPAALFFGNLGLASIYDWLERPEQAKISINRAKAAAPAVQDPTYLFEFWLLAAYVAMAAEDEALAVEAFEQLAIFTPLASSMDESWVNAAFLKVSIARAVEQLDYQTAYELSESLRLLQTALLESEKAALSGEARTNTDSTLLQRESARLAETNQRQLATLINNQRYQFVLVILLLMLAAAAVALFLALKKQVRQRRVLQQFSTIGQSSKTSGQRTMENVAGLLFEQAQRKNAPMSVIVFELKNIADIRERYDDLTAERIQQWFQAVLHKEMRVDDKLGQVSFSRYLLVLPNATARVARRMVEHVTEALNQQDAPGLIGVKLDVVAGVTERSQHDNHSLSLTNRAATAADMALDTAEGPIKVMPA